MTKLCAHCGKTKPWSAFQAAARWPANATHGDDAT